MRKFTPIIIVVLALAVAVGAVLFAMRRQPAESGTKAAEPVAPSAASSVPQALEVKGAEVEQRDPQGKLEWKVTAGGELRFDKGRQVAHGKDVKFEVMQSEKPRVVVLARQFEANYNARKLTFSDGVSGRTVDGSSRFTVGRMEYDFGTKKLVGTGGAEYREGSYSATAPELVLDTKAQKVRLRGGVRFTRSR